MFTFIKCLIRWSPELWFSCVCVRLRCAWRGLANSMSSSRGSAFHCSAAYLCSRLWQSCLTGLICLAYTSIGRETGRMILPIGPDDRGLYFHRSGALACGFTLGADHYSCSAASKSKLAFALLVYNLTGINKGNAPFNFDFLNVFSVTHFGQFLLNAECLPAQFGHFASLRQSLLL